MPHHDAASARDRGVSTSQPYVGSGPPVSLTAVVRRRRQVLEPSRIQLRPGTRVGLVGRNGAGKTSLLHALTGLLRRGRVSDWGDRGTPTSIALVAQHPIFPAGVRVESILQCQGVALDDLDQAAPGLLEAGILARRSDQLSAGQRQRVAAAAALARSDPLILLDEPYSSLDVPGRLALRQALERRCVRQPDVTIVIAAHAPADLYQACDSVIALAGGRAMQLPAEHLAPSGNLHAFERALVAMLEPRE